MRPVTDVRGAYDASAAAWLRGPEAVYEAMAEALVAQAPVGISGARVLDLGTGTGPAARAAHRAGAGVVVGVDLSINMLRAGRGWDGAVQADASMLPFPAGAFALATAAFSLGHLPDPAAGIAEARRVAAALVASAFRSGWTHPAKRLVDDAASRLGFRTPDWYLDLKSGPEAEVDDPDRLATLAVHAGFRDVHVVEHRVDVGLRDPEVLAAWRLGMAHLAPFVQSLAPAQQLELHRASVEALEGVPPVVVPVVMLVARS